MKRILTVIILGILCLSMFVVISPKAKAATAPVVVNPLVNESSSSITLSAGADIYLYGYGTGGGAPSGNFAYGQYTSLTNMGGYEVASLGITTSNTNSFSTGSGYPVIGGVGVQSFSSYSSSFGSNNSPAAPSASDSFTVTTSGSLVVVIAIGGDEQSLTVSGLPGLQADASWPGSPWNALQILHTYLDVGSYTVTEYTSQSAAGQTPAYAGDLIGVFVFTPNASSSNSIGLSTPAINGLTVDFNGGASPGNQVTYIQWSWGDGSVDNGWFPHSHTYTSSGAYSVIVTAHYNDGSTASTSTGINVYPGEMTGGDKLTISASSGGSVSYTASVGSGTVPPGGSTLLYLAFADDLSLTANPSSGYSFQSWTATSGISGATTSPSINIVVTSDSSIVANFGATGFQFSILANPAYATIAAGQSASTSVTVSLVSGFGNVGLFVSNLPPSATYYVSPASGAPPYTSTLTIYTSAYNPTPAGTYTITVEGVSSSLTESTSFTLVVVQSLTSGPQLSASLSPPELTIQQGTGMSAATLTIKNVGTGLLSWSVGSAYWISFSQNQGTTASGSESLVAVQVQASLMPTGTQSATITAQSNGGTQTLTLTVTQANLSPPIMAPPSVGGQSYTVTFSTEYSSFPSGHTAIVTINGESYQWVGSNQESIPLSIPLGTQWLPFTITIQPNDFSVDPAQGSVKVYLPVYSETTQYVEFYPEGSNPPVKISPNSGSSTSGYSVNMQASLEKNQNNLYDFQLKLTPATTVDENFIALNQTQAYNVEEQIIKELQSQNFNPTIQSKISLANAPDDYFDQKGITFVDDLLWCSVNVPQAISDIHDYGIYGVALTALNVYNDPPPSLSQALPETVTTAINKMLTTISTFEEKILHEGAATKLSGQPYSADYIAGPGQEILITLTNMSFNGQSLPDNVELYLSGENGIRRGTFEQPDSGGVYNFGLGGFNVAPMSLSRGFYLFGWWVSNPWFGDTYIVSLYAVQDPISPFLEISTFNVLLDNLSFNSSSSTLFTDVSLVDDSTGGNLTFLVPLLLDSSNSSAFLFTLNGKPISFNLVTLSDYGYYLTVNVNSKGALIMSIPKAPPSLIGTTDEGRLLIFGNGWPSNVSLSLQCFDGADWINLTNEPMMTSEAGGFFFSTSSILTVNSDFVTFRASDLYGEIACTSVSADSLASNIGHTVTFDQLGVGAGFNGTVLVVDGKPYNVSALPVSFNWSVGSVHTFAFQSPLTVGANAGQYVWTSITGLSSLQSDSINVTTYGSVVGNYKTQYYLTLATSPSDVATTTGAGWYDANTYALISTDQYANVTAGCSRYNFTGWTTSNKVEITNPYSPSTTLLMDKAKTVTANYMKQYYLNISVNFGTASPSSGWFNAGSNVTISAVAPSTIAGERYLWIGWVGFGCKSYIGMRSTATVTMQGPVWEFALWDHQYLLTVKTNGLPSPYSTEVSIGWFELGRASNFSAFTMWITAGTRIGGLSVDSCVSGRLGTRYVFTSWSDGTAINPHSSIMMNGPQTLTANYKTASSPSHSPPKCAGFCSDQWFADLD